MKRKPGVIPGAAPQSAYKDLMCVQHVNGRMKSEFQTGPTPDRLTNKEIYSNKV